MKKKNSDNLLYIIEEKRGHDYLLEVCPSQTVAELRLHYYLQHGFNAYLTDIKPSKVNKDNI